MALGMTLGLALGDIVGAQDGDADGNALGARVGQAVGTALGDALGEVLGGVLGAVLGETVGAALGEAVHGSLVHTGYWLYTQPKPVQLVSQSCSPRPWHSASVCAKVCGRGGERPATHPASSSAPTQRRHPSLKLLSDGSQHIDAITAP